jgi:hypothetical protein
MILVDMVEAEERKIAQRREAADKKTASKE